MKLSDYWMLDAKHILATVATSYQVAISALIVPNRTADVVRARDFVVYLCREKLDLEWLRIGSLLQRHHTTCILAYDRCKTRLETDDRYRRELQFIEALLVQEQCSEVTIQ